MQPRIMYIECKSSLAGGTAYIGRVSFSQTGRTIYYRGRRYQKTKSGYKYNCFDVDTGIEYWISGPKRDGSDRLYGEGAPVHIDDDVREEYWLTIRKRPGSINRRSYCATVPKKYQN